MKTTVAFWVLQLKARHWQVNIFLWNLSPRAGSKSLVSGSQAATFRLPKIIILVNLSVPVFLITFDTQMKCPVVLLIFVRYSYCSHLSWNGYLWTCLPEARQISLRIKSNEENRYWQVNQNYGVVQLWLVLGNIRAQFDLPIDGMMTESLLY